MSTRCNVIIKDSIMTLFFYRHSDGYPECAGEDLIEFVNDYKNRAMRLDAMQSAGWLIIRGNVEYGEGILNPRPNSKDKYSGWKVGAYGPTDQLHGDIEWLYTIDLDECSLTFKDTSKNKITKKVNFKPKSED